MLKPLSESERELVVDAHAKLTEILRARAEDLTEAKKLYREQGMDSPAGVLLTLNEGLVALRFVLDQTR